MTTLRFARTPLASLDRWAARYGDPFTIRAVNGNVVTTGRPELIKTIFAQDPDQYLPFGVDAIVVLAGRRSIFVQNGTAHRRQRRLLMPPFHGARLEAYETIVADATRHRMSAAGNRPTAMLEVAQAISLDVIIRAVFGAREEETEAIEAAVQSLVSATHPLLLFIPAFQRELAGRGPFARLRRALSETDMLLQERIRKARDNGGDDILSLLLAARDEDGAPMTDDEIRDHLRTLLFAGHETTAIALTWAVDLLGRHPDVAVRARQETLNDGPSPCLSAVVDETLRLYPPVSEVLRLLKTPMSLGSWTLPEGTVVSPSIHLLHRNPTVYDEPDRFRPERFIDRKPKPDHFMPFGGGHRRCIGAAFARWEMTVALATILREFDVEPVNERPPRVVRRNVTLAPSDGVPVSVRPRPISDDNRVPA